MSRLLHDLRYAVRGLRKTPGFTMVAVVVLALGVGANSAIFTIANALVFKPLPGRADELVGVYAYDRTTPDSFRAFSYPNYADLRDRGVFDGLLAQTFALVGLPSGDTTRRTFAALVSSNYFDVIGVRLAAGRTFTREEERPGARLPVAIVGYTRWKESGFSPAYVGSSLRINGRTFTIVGVAAKGFAGTMAVVAPELWLPLGEYDTVVNDFLKSHGEGLASRAHAGLMVSGHVSRAMPEAVSRARLDAAARQLAEQHPAENKGLAFVTQRLSRLTLSTRPQNEGVEAAAMVLFLGLSGAVLLIACLNIANMLLARSTARGREFALRLALGGSRSRVAALLLTEGALLSLVGAACGLLLSYLAARALGLSLMAALPLTLEFDPRPDGRVLAATITFAALSTLIFALGPALKLSRRDLMADLRETTSAARGRRFGARDLLVVVQVALSLALLTAGGLFARAAVAATAATPGFSYDGLVVASIDPSLAAYDDVRAWSAHRTVLERVRGLASVEAASVASRIPFGNFQESERVERLGTSRANAPDATYRIIGADYFRTLGLKVLRGRDFTPAEEASGDAPRTAIVDALLARNLFGEEEPLGQSIRIARRAGDARAADPMVVVGIAPPLRDEINDPGPVPHLYVPSGRDHRAEMHLHVRSRQRAGAVPLVQAVRRELRAVDAQLPVLELKTMRAFHEESLGLWILRAGGYMFTVLGLLALLLAVVGVYGVRSYVVAQRTREFGIRMALGADGAQVRALVLREGIAVCAAGLLAGLPLAIGVAQGIASVLHRIGGLDPVVFAAAPLTLLVAAFVASYIPARRATAIAPLEALRES